MFTNCTSQAKYNYAWLSSHVAVGGVDVILTSSEFSAVSDQYTLNCAAVITEADQLNPTITYQWFKNNTVVSGETQSTLSFFSLSLSDAGQYRCNVTVSSTLLSQSIIAMSNTQDLTLQSKLVQF